MKLPFALFLSVFSFALVGCAPKAATPAAVTTSASVPAGPRVIELTVGGESMKFSVARIEAAAGEELKVVLTNAGTIPKEVMGHNFVLLQTGTDIDAFTQAAMLAKADDYLPSALLGQVLAHINLLGPKQSGEVVFKAPSVPGEYTYLCTFPGHYLSGMKGVLVVK